MKNGHIIQIEESFDEKRQCFHAVITLQEFREERQYGGAVVTEYSGPKNGDHKRFMQDVCEVVKRDVLSFMTYTIK